MNFTSQAQEPNVGDKHKQTNMKKKRKNTLLQLQKTAVRAAQGSYNRYVQVLAKKKHFV